MITLPVSIGVCSENFTYVVRLINRHLTRDEVWSNSSAVCLGLKYASVCHPNSEVCVSGAVLLYAQTDRNNTKITSLKCKGTFKKFEGRGEGVSYTF
jgi:hypothetical protein